MSWVRTKEDIQDYTQDHPAGGPGHMLVHPIIQSEDELLGKGRLFKLNTLEKDCGVGYHVHEGDTEFYIILSGEGEYNDNGTVRTVKAGAVTFTGDGEGHSLTNHSDEPLSFVALILYA